MRRALWRLYDWALCRVGYHDWAWAYDVRTGEWQGWYCMQCGKGRDAAEVEQ